MGLATIAERPCEKLPKYHERIKSESIHQIIFFVGCSENRMRPGCAVAKIIRPQRKS